MFELNKLMRLIVENYQVLILKNCSFSTSVNIQNFLLKTGNLCKKNIYLGEIASPGQHLFFSFFFFFLKLL